MKYTLKGHLGIHDVDLTLEIHPEDGLPDFEPIPDPVPPSDTPKETE